MNFFPRITAITMLTPLVASTVIVDSVFAQNTLSGKWLVVHEGAHNDNWEIQVSNNQLSIIVFNEKVPGVSLIGDYRRPLSIESATSNQQGIYLRVRINESIVYEYQLSFISPNRIQGVYRSVDTTLNDLGIISGETGVITKSGRIIMTRIQ